MAETYDLPYLYVPIQNILVTGLFLSTIFVFIHLAVKRRALSGFTTDDVCLVLSWGLSLATQTIILYALNHAGLGIHILLLSLPTINKFQKLYLGAICMFMSCFCLAKVAQLWLLHRLTPTKSRFRASLYCLACVIVLGSITTSCCLIFACRPVSKSWNAAEQGQCLNRGAVYVAIAVLNIISDLALTMLPIFLVVSSQLPSSQKARTIPMMLVFCITVFTGAVRLAVTIPLLHSDDATYSSAPVALLVGAECNLFIITASIPGVRQCFRILSTHSYSYTESPPQSAFDFD